ncbi:BatA domain-containing protein [uncultured Nevskia sp.]|uniref:BatA domain-containing protein n=1 Tax=uncultured Nevskia sp. TaxID=228950 RepID=UPI0025EE792D|nr:BatA domain-containing protein [uncultured Nevskia sp.]
MISFAAAFGLLALAALVIPIAIHLIRRRAARDVPFAALAWLAARTPPRRQWRLDDRWLLAVRLLLIALLAALLAEPIWRSPDGADAAAVYVAPGIDANAARAAFDAPLADWHWLAAGYPSLDEPAPAADPHALQSLIRELDRELPAATKLSIVVPAELVGLDGERLRLGREVVWRSLPAASVPQELAPAAQPFRIAIRVTSAAPTAASVARALTAAWQAAGMAIEIDDQPPGAPISKNSSLLIVSGGKLDEATQALASNGLNVLLGDPQAKTGEVLLRDVEGQPLLRRQAPQIYALAGPLDPVAWPALRDPQLPAALLKLLRPAVPPPDRAPAVSVAPLRAAVDSAGPATPLTPWFALAIALLWLIERLLATRRRSEA